MGGGFGQLCFVRDGERDWLEFAVGVVAQDRVDVFELRFDDGILLGLDDGGDSFFRCVSGVVVSAAGPFDVADEGGEVLEEVAGTVVDRQQSMEVRVPLVQRTVPLVVVLSPLQAVGRQLHPVDLVNHVCG